MWLITDIDVTLLSWALNCAALLVALVVDWRLGEPPTRWHPVVWMGNFLRWAGKRIAPQAEAEAKVEPEAVAQAPDYQSFTLGLLCWCVGAATVFVASWALQTAILYAVDSLVRLSGSLLTALLLASVPLGLALKPLLAWAMLKSEVQAVEAALGTSLQAGRARLAWLVSRDVSTLTESQVRESAIESLAENLNDSVVAPIFWFVLLGLPGAALYRFANTADAMWGYRGVRNGQVWEWAGKWAAWADDVLSWLPARLTALLLMAVAGCMHWRELRQQARLTPSPNSGWPMTAMALAVGIRLGKPGVYTLNAPGRFPQEADTATAVVLARNAVLALIPLALAAMILIVV